MQQQLNALMAAMESSKGAQPQAAAETPSPHGDRYEAFKSPAAPKKEEGSDLESPPADPRENPLETGDDGTENADKNGSNVAQCTRYLEVH